MSFYKTRQERLSFHINDFGVAVLNFELDVRVVANGKNPFSILSQLELRLVDFCHRE